jgi:hypothetical protein
LTPSSDAAQAIWSVVNVPHAARPGVGVGVGVGFGEVGVVGATVGGGVGDDDGDFDGVLGGGVGWELSITTTCGAVGGWVAAGPAAGRVAGPDDEDGEDGEDGDVLGAGVVGAGEPDADVEGEPAEAELFGTTTSGVVPGVVVTMNPPLPVPDDAC